VCMNIMMYMCDELNLKDIDYHSLENIEVEEYQKEKTIVHSMLPKNGTYLMKNFRIVVDTLVIGEKSVIVNSEKKPFKIVKTMTIYDDSCEDTKNILNFIEQCNDKKMKQLDKLSSDRVNKINVKLFNGYYWETISIIPKRNPDTVFLKDGQKEEISNVIDNFIDENTYEEYTQNGIPYKCNIMLHGPPGVGKTSVIYYIASKYNVDISTININNDLKENDFLTALRGCNNTKKFALIVIEDIDCIFTNRKDHDSARNHLTLQGILNCLDGFNSKEGLVIIMTTNRPEDLDEALTRTRRIDHMIELSFLNKYQAQNMFQHFFKKQHDAFERIWETLKSYEIPPSTFHQFLFNNRKSDNVLSLIPTLITKLKQSAGHGIYN